MSAPPFVHADAFRAAFAAGLGGLLCEGSGLGAFILAFNNAAFDARLRAVLGPTLTERFEQLAASFRESLKRGSDPAGSPDDIGVFLRMLAVGYGDLPPVAIRQVGPWEVQLNPLRAFRPARAAAQPRTTRHGSLRLPFDPSGFHFNRPLLRPETFWSGEYRGRRLDLLFNKFPFLELQTILVPDRESESPQFLMAPDHRLLWSLTASIGGALPGVMIGYNSLGAFASVNHLHFHLTPRGRALPLMDPRWRHNGGDQSYPVDCRVLDHCDRAWDAIDALQRRDQTFNLIYTPGRLYCLPRRHQVDCAAPDWYGGLAWYELAGGCVCFDAERFQRLEADEIRRAIATAALPAGDGPPA